MLELSAPVYWLIIFIVLLGFEIATMGLTTIWFAGGALVAALIAWIGLGEPVQIIVFLAVSILLLCLTRPIALKYVNGRAEKTNAASLVGQETLVIETVDALASTGKVRINGIEWLAKSEDLKNIIAVGAVVTIKEIKGVTLIVAEK